MNETRFSRRSFFRGLAGLLAGAAALKELLFARNSWGQTTSSGLPQPDELVDATLKRLFGARSFQSGEGKIKLELPLIAEDGGNVAVTVDSSLPVSGAARVSNVYIFPIRTARRCGEVFTYAGAAERQIAQQPPATSRTCAL